jgi:hypothetical protein
MDGVDRRTFLAASAGAAAMLAAWRATPVRGDGARSPATPRVAIVDRDVAGAAAFAAAARARGLRLFEFTSDAAHVWMHELEPRLRSGPLEIWGHTGPATLFCLDLLARDYGADAVRSLGASAWLIATSPTRRAPLAPPIQQRQG